MILKEVKTMSEGMSYPRVSGGDPVSPSNKLAHIELSPRERG